MAKITDDGWEEVQPDGDGGWDDLTDGRSGDDTANPAFEVNGNTAPVGTVVKLYPGLNDEYLYWFGGASGFPALLTHKTHSETPFTDYSFTQLTDSDSPDPLTYNSEPLTGTAYHQNNLDFPVAPTFDANNAHSSLSTTDTSAGDVGWVNPSNIEIDDTNVAASTFTGAQTTQYLTGKGFSFSLPTDAIVINVAVDVKVSATATTVSDLEVKLIKGGTITGNNKATNTALSTSETTMSYSYSPLGWGVALTGSDVNSSGFGLALRYGNSSGNPTVQVQYASISVKYARGVARHSVVRMNKGGDGEYWVFGEHPWNDLFIRTDSSDAGGVIGFLRYYDQNTGTWQNGEQVRIILAE